MIRLRRRRWSWFPSRKTARVQEHAEAQLQRAGWRPGRRVNIDNAVAALRADGHAVWPDLLQLLEEFDGLTISTSRNHNPVVLDAAAATAGIATDWVREYAGVIGAVLTPIGEYSHMTIYYNQNGAFYGGFDRDFGCLGHTVIEVVDHVLNTDPPPPFDLTVLD